MKIFTQKELYKRNEKNKLELTLKFILFFETIIVGLTVMHWRGVKEVGSGGNLELM